MSLQVWLPLNGSLENLGLADVGEIDTTNISFTDNGKIGKCLTGYTGYFNIPSMTGKKQLSVAYWIRINTATSTQWLDAFRWHSTDGSSSYSSRNEFYNDCTTTGFWFKGGSISGKTTTVGDWHHHAFTIDYEVGTAIFYIDGILKGSSSAVDTTHYLTGTNFMIGENGLDASHNDVRIYDHMLSTKEVKELSKGLVAHYPLNDFIGNPNLLPMDHGVNNVNTRTNYYLGGTSNSVYHQLDAGTYTISVSFQNREAYPNVYYLKRNGSNVNIGSASASRTFELEESGEYRFWLYANPNSMPGIEDDQVVNFKLEKGLVATPWIPNTEDDLYSAMGLDENIVYDCSGYNHHGTFSPVSPVVDSDSIRYSSCMKFNGSNNYVDLGIDTWCPTDQITVSMWVYRDVWQSANSKPISCTESGGFNFEEGSGGGYRFPVYKNGSSYIYGIPVKKWADYSPGWHFIVGTFDGYVSKIYIDGEYDNGSANSDTKALIRYNANAKLFLGCEAATANPHAPYLDGKLSDVRIYATALSAEDIKALYETSVSIDDKGNFHAYEISEV